jgi:uncharacterized protein YjbI with pentapeptide repeats
MANQKQLEILRQGVKVWNDWRNQNKIDYVDLRDADLREANLVGANLSDVNLWRSDLKYADLRASYLSRTNLSGAILTGCNFSMAIMEATVLGNSDFSEAIGLDQVVHHGPSSISTDTIKLSKGKIPEIFLRGCGLSDVDIEYAKLSNPDLTNDEINNILYRIYDLRANQAVQISPIIISYSPADTSFVNKLEANLNKKGIRVWREVHDMKAGGMEREISRTIHQNATVLLILSQHSLKSDWVEHEVRTARSLEKEIHRDVLCPVSLDDTWKDSRWSKQIMEQVTEYNILDFSLWRDDLKFENNFGKLIEGLELNYVSATSDIGTKNESLSNLRIGAEHPNDEPSDKSERAASDEVSFTAFYPKEGKIYTWYTLLVYIHLLSALVNVRKDAKRFEDEIKSPKESSLPSSVQIVQGTEITIVPSCEGITFNPEYISLKWTEDFHRADFRFRAEKSLLGDAAKGYISIYVGPLIVGTLKFALLLNEFDSTPLHNQEVQSRMYHKDAIFISYSHKDTEIALAFKKVHEATGYDVLIDIDQLRSGQDWNSELMQMIDRADIFQLFWSENSKNSKYCKQEWKHALKRKAEGFIRPVYWQKPIPDPPKELSKYHFEYVNLHENNI